MKLSLLLLCLILFSPHFASNGQEGKLKIDLSHAKPVWWFQLRESDLCVKASSISLHAENMESLSNVKGEIIMVYFPVTIEVDKILSLSRRMEFDGRFSEKNDSHDKGSHSLLNQLQVFYAKNTDVSERGAVDQHFIGPSPSLPYSCILTLTKSNHKKRGEFMITSIIKVEEEEAVTNAITLLNTSLRE